MRTMALILLASAVGCGSPTAPVVEDECGPAGSVAGVTVNGAEVDTSMVVLYELCVKRHTYQLP